MYTRFALAFAALSAAAQVPDFTLTTPAGQPVSFSALKGETTVVMFISTKCPVSNRYNTRMTALYRDYTPRGVKFVFINANQNEPPTEVAEHSRQAEFPFPVYKDAGNVVADRFGAGFTPESYVIDKAGVVRYHGRIDDAQTEARIQHNSLRLALDAVLTGQAVATPDTKAFGCTIKRVRGPS